MTLIICEKDNAARRIAEILSKGTAKRSVIDGVPFYDFVKNGKEYSVIGLRGHILNLDYPDEYNVWEKVDPKKLVWVDPYKRIQAQKIVDLLEQFVYEDNEIIIATDYDREGELIGVEGLEVVKHFNPRVTAKRARFSALTKEEITRAFENLSEIDYNLSLSAEARQIIDLIWGASLTRFISLSSRQIGKDFLSVGRVQTPTLALILKREEEIKSFVPKPYWELTASLKHLGIEFTATHSTARFWDETAARAAYDNAVQADTGKIVEVSTETKTEKPPAPFNTTSFLRAATKLGFSAAGAMAIAEELYINGWISYTRTDNTVYPKTLDLKAILRKLTHTEFRENAEALLGLPKLVPSRGKRTATDHPPIYPVGAANRKQLEDAQWKIYELVVRRFLATLAPEAVAEVTRAKIDINNELFLAHGYKIIDPGWRRHYTYIGIKEKHLPELTQGTEVSVCGVEILDKETLPPKRYGQGVLIQEMDRLGLGTKSTRHEIIQKLYERGYIEGTPIVPTVTGTAVTRALEKYAGTITSPEMTSRLEEDMDKIAEGTKELKTVVRDSRKMLSSILDVLDAHKHNVSKTIREALREQNIIGKCTDCEGNLIILRSRIGKRFVGCTNFPKCRKGYPLPQKGRIISTGKVCDTCGAPRIKLVTRRRRTYTLCINMECPEKEAQQETKTLQEPDAQSSNSNCKTH